MKNCLMCGEPISNSRRGDSLYCDNSCKAKYFELKKKGHLPKNSLNGLTYNTDSDKNNSDFSSETQKKDTTTNYNKVKSIDMEDLTAFDNLVEDWDNFDAKKTESPAQKNNESIAENTNKTEWDNLTTSFGNNFSKTNLPVKFIKKEIEKDNPIYLNNKSIIQNYTNDIQKCDTEIKRLTSLLRDTENNTGNSFLLSGVIGGSLLAGFLYTPKDKTIPTGDKTKSTYAKKINKLKQENKEKETKNIFTTIFSVAAGLGIGYILKEEFKENNRITKKQAIVHITQAINKVQSMRAEALKERDSLVLKNYYVKKKLIETIEAINPDYTKALVQQNTNNDNNNSNKENLGTIKTDTTSTFKDLKPNPFNGLKVEPVVPIKPIEKVNPLETDKITSIKKIANLKHDLLDFKGRWFDFFGRPQTNFFCVIHGMSGEGKTNFSIQFAKYLAENHGNVLYVSGEEGFAPTFQQKIKDLGAENVSRLYAIDIRTGQEILTEIPNKYHFIVIDSANNMRIDPNLMEAIRNKFKQSGFIAICQSTKKGEIRGSYEIVHDSDIEVKVVKGIANTEKNRFKAVDQKFDVFAVYRKTQLTIVKKNGTNNSIDKLDFDNIV